MKKYYFFLFIGFLLSAQDHHVHTPWNLDGAKQRIDSIRKGNALIEFELNGQKFTGKTGQIQLDLDRHEFKFGVSMTQSRSFAQADQSFSSHDFVHYKQRVAELFNFTTVGFYWTIFDEQRNLSFPKKYIRHVLDWANENRIEVKGHPLMWHESLPKWVAALEDTEKVDKLIFRRIRTLLESYPSIQYWDVYNEPVAVFKDHVTPNGVTRWVADKGGIYPAMKSLYSFVNGIDSTKVYTNNHYNPKSDAFFEINKHFVENNVQYSAIGMQAHMQTHDGVLDEQTLWDMMDRYATLGKDIQFTELTVTSSKRFKDWREHQVFLAKKAEARKRGENLTLPSLSEYEDYQAAYVKDFYTLVFSHPQVTSITFWNLSDKNAWRGHAGGLLDKNMAPKKAYNTLKRLIKQTWHTAIDASVNLEEAFSFSGFYGSYTGTLSVDGKSYPISFDHKKGNSETVLIPLSE